MTPHRIAPVATDQDRRAIAWLVCRINPDWQPSSVASLLARATDQQLDHLAVAALVATVTRPDQTKPELLARTGDHTLAALTALQAPKPSEASRLPSAVRTAAPTCDRCGVPWTGHTTQDHPYTSAADGFTEATPGAARRARERWGIPNDQTGA